MSKQYEFRASVLPYVLVMPQMVIVFIFFFWPAAQAVLQSFYLQDPLGGRMIFVGFQNYVALLPDPD
jgi:sn-glycerol 3-phosphate transport system permease protein